MASPVGAWDMTLAMDYGQFSLAGDWTSADEFADEFEDASAVYEDTLQAALSGNGIAKAGNLVVIVSPHQNNFAMAVTVELWASEPDSDLDEWQEVFQAGVEVDAQGLQYASPTMTGETIALDPGRYGLRVSGTGFVAHGWPGSTTPGDHWRWQMWRTADEVSTRRLRSWDGAR